MTTTIDPQLAAKAVELASAGKSLNAIADATGLLPNEIRTVVDRDRQRREYGVPPTTPVRPAFQPPATRVDSTPPPVADRRPMPLAAADALATLITDGQASDMPRVRTAAKRAQAAIDHLREVLAATEQERREKAAAKAKAERARAERAAKEQAARDAVAAAEAALAKAKADLAAAGGEIKTRRKMTLTDEQREAARARGRIAAARTAEIRRQKRDARLAAEAAT